ncbi:MAG: hypothetical protein WBG48_10730, partial [Pricia sp.]
MRPFLIFVLLVTLMACQGPVERTPAEINTEHRIEIDDCGVTYNGQKLKFRVPLEEWETVLGKCKLQGGIRIWNELGIGVVQTRINQEHPGDDGDLVVDRFMVFFQNRDDYRPLLFYPTNPETYPDSTFKGAITLNGALIARGMGYSEIQQRLDETGKSRKLEINDDVRRGTNPYIYDGIPGEYTRPPLTSCDGRRFAYNFHMARIDPPEDEKQYWDNLKDYEKGNAIEVLEIHEISAGGYFHYGKKSFSEGTTEKDVSKIKEGKKLLQRAIEKGS